MDLLKSTTPAEIAQARAMTEPLVVSHGHGAELRAAMTIHNETLHEALPVHGYVAQPDATVALVNHNKMLEEHCLQTLDALKERTDIDQHWLAIGRTQLEQAWMAINRSIFKPQRPAADLSNS